MTIHHGEESLESLTDRSTTEIMPVLKNARHEKFAQARFEGKTADESYDAAGLKPHRGNASRLSANENVVAWSCNLRARNVPLSPLKA